jgi:cytochrome bd-type quinol oxidase subunit 2
MTTSSETSSTSASNARLERTLLLVIVLAFGAFTAVAVAIDGLSGIVDAITYNWLSVQIFIDLVLAIAVIAVWMHRDARRTGRNPWPWIIACPFVGIFSPLGYLITRTPAA